MYMFGKNDYFVSYQEIKNFVEENVFVKIILSTILCVRNYALYRVYFFLDYTKFSVELVLNFFLVLRYLQDYLFKKISDY